MPGWGLCRLVGEVGLSSAGGAYEPSKSLEYMLENLSLEDREGGRGNTLAEARCLSRMALADLTLSCASFTTFCWPTGEGLTSGWVGSEGDNRALADLTLLGLDGLELISMRILPTYRSAGEETVSLTCVFCLPQRL